MSQAEIIEGPRGPRSTRLEAMRASADAKAPLKEGRQGTHYVSAFRRYRVQITSPADTLNPTTGRIERGRPIVAQFEDWQYWNNAKDQATRELIDQALQENFRFGMSLDFWLADEQKERAQAKKLADARKTLASLPQEVRDEFIAEALAMSDQADHTLPAPPEKK